MEGGRAIGTTEKQVCIPCAILIYRARRRVVCLAWPPKKADKKTAISNRERQNNQTTRTPPFGRPCSLPPLSPRAGKGKQEQPDKRSTSGTTPFPPSALPPLLSATLSGSRTVCSLQKSNYNTNTRRPRPQGKTLRPSLLLLSSTSRGRNLNTHLFVLLLVVFSTFREPNKKQERWGPSFLFLTRCRDQ